MSVDKINGAPTVNSSATPRIARRLRHHGQKIFEIGYQFLGSTLQSIRIVDFCSLACMMVGLVGVLLWLKFFQFVGAQ